MKKIDLTDGSTIEMREPKVRDMRIASEDTTDDVEKEVKLIANLTSKTVDEIEDLTMKDYGKLQEALKGFLSSGGKSVKKA